MRQIAIVVEGQTEAAFVTQILDVALGEDFFLTPIITHTKRTARGTHRGGGGWTGYREHLRRLISQPHWGLVTTMIDFYAYPTDAPGHGCHAVGAHEAHACVETRAEAMRAELPGEWLPFIMLYEFETLVLAAGSQMPAVLGDSTVPSVFDRIVREAGGAERVNAGPQTAPSKRVAQVIPGYRKAIDGIDIIRGCGLQQVREECPHFSTWIDRLRG